MNLGDSGTRSEHTHRLFVETAAGEERHARTGAVRPGGEPFAALRPVPAASGREDAVDLGKGEGRVDRRFGIVHCVEGTMQSNREPGRGGHHRGDQVEIERALSSEPDYRSVDAEIGEAGKRPLQRDQLTRAGHAEAVALAHHHAQRQRHLRLEGADEIEGRRQTIALDLADDLETIGAAGVSLTGVGDRLDDDFEERRSYLFFRKSAGPQVRERYSCLSAISGSTRVALRAGSQAANAATVERSTATAP